MSKLQDSSISIPVPSLPLKKHKHEHKIHQNSSPAISLLAGATAGATEAAITYPFEFAKTRYQLRHSAYDVAAATTKNPFSTLLQTVRKNGIGAVYTGCSTLVIGTACKAGVRFLTFDFIKTIISDGDGKLSPARGLLAGMVAGAVESVVAITPTERIKTALIDDARMPVRRYKGGAHALRVIITEHGVAEVYRGLVSTTIKQSATSAVRMGTYSSLKESVSPRFGVYGNHPVATFGLGAVAGIVTVFATQPFDTVKTRTQGATGTTISVAARDIFRDGGARAFWGGSSMRLSRLVLSGGIVFTVYESVAETLTRMRTASD